MKLALNLFIALVVLAGIAVDLCCPVPAGAVLSEFRPAPAQFIADGDPQNDLPIMKPSRETRNKWFNNYKKAARAPISQRIKLLMEAAPSSEGIQPLASLDLRSHLQYTPSQRNQGSCGNCWAWAGTGVMEIALDVQSGIKDRLSIQYLNSNYNGGSGSNWACCGGWLDDVVSFYSSKGMAVPWSNTNAAYADGSRTCATQLTAMPAASIVTSLNYPISSITEQTVTTHGLSQSTAIANIKNVLNQNKAISFSFFLATGADWTNFRNFWNYQSESVIWDPDFSLGHTYDSGGGGHSVLCVGYDDSDPDPAKRYWLILNSWGTTSGRPNGLFRLAMDMNYSGTFYDYPTNYYSFYWQTLDMTYTGATAPAISTLPASNVNSTSATLNGNLTSTGGAATTVHIYWGDNDGGATAGNWDTDINLGARSIGAFSSAISGLTTGTTYYYRCYATNSAGSTWADSSTSFVAQTFEKYLGTDSTSSQGNHAAHYFLLNKFTAEKTGNLNQIRVYCGASGNVKAALYSDSSGSPGALLVANNTGTPCVSGWNNISVASTPVTSGATYWLAFISDASCVGYYVGGGTVHYRAATYSTFAFPSPAGSLNGPWYGYDLLAGWGSTGAPTPSAPTITNASGTTGVSTTSATLNGNLTSDGNATTTVHIYWGDNDGGTTAGNWDTDINLGTRSIGAFSSAISGLTTGTTYYYRCYATNSAGSAWAYSSASFIAQTPTTPEKLLGTDSTSSMGNHVANYFLLSKFTAQKSGNLNQIRVYCGASGNVKAALYSDSSGSPGTLLVANNTGTPCVSGWNNISVASTPVTSGTIYWLAFIADASSVQYQAGGGTMLYSPTIYSTFTFPSPAGSLSGSYVGYNLLAGWGSTAAPTPSAPTITNASGATGVSTTSATLNGNLTSDGNATTTVHIYWGDNDGGTTAGNWDTDINLGTRSIGAFSSAISGLTTGTTYYYRCYATNSAGSAWEDSSASFIAQTPTTPEKLLGTNSTSSQGNHVANYFLLSKFTAEKTGNLNQIRVYCGASGNVKAALYSDSSGSPGTLLVANNTGTPCVSGWNNISVASTPVTSGTIYWLAFIADASSVQYQAGGGTMLYSPTIYSTFTFPSPAGSLSGSYVGYNLLAGWGSIATPTPPSPPSLTSPGATITFKWTSSTGATGYTLQVNTSSGFDAGTMLFNQNVGNLTSYEVSGLSLATTYYWRVNASNAAGTSAWSAVRSVTVNSSP